MVNKLLIVVGIAALAWVAYLYGASQAVRIPNLPCDRVRAELDVYRECLRLAGKTRCHMQVDDFRKYHQLKANLDKHCVVIEPLNRPLGSVAD